MINFRYLVTSALPYVNNVPHLGNFIGSVLPADVYSRFLKLKGEECIYVCGTDDYGTPITVEADKEGITPKQLTDRYYKVQQEVFKKLWVDFDIFSRTSSEEHVKVVQEFYLRLKKNGYIYKKEIEQLYCEKDKRFLPDRYVEGTCPYCGGHARGDQCEICGKLLEPTKLLEPYCIICKKKPVLKKSEHVFFELSKLTEQLQAWIGKSEHWFPNARSFSLNWIKDGLEDRCISRDLSWGVPVPDLHGKVFYVWFDAPQGYITFTKQLGKEDWWHDKETRLIHFLGKDNIAFHTIFFPGVLIAVGGYILPYQIASYEFLNYEGKKFSKSKNVGIFLPDAVKLYPADYWRYYLLSILTEHKDSDFLWEEFYKRINSDLNDTLGNFLHRTLTLTKTSFGGRIPKPGRLSKSDEKVFEEIAKTHSNVTKLLEEIKLKEALSEAIELARVGNRYLTEEEPWKKEDNREAVIYVCLNICKALSVLLDPFIPESAKKIREFLNIKGYDWGSAVERIKSDKIGDFKPLFKKIEKKEIEENKKRFKGK